MYIKTKPSQRKNENGKALKLTPQQFMRYIYHRHFNYLKVGFLFLRGQGVAWGQIMKNKECLVGRRGHGRHFTEKFVEKILFEAKVIRVTAS